MADDGDASAGPVWERRARRGGSNPLVGLIVTFLALFGALTIGLAVADKSVAAAGAKIDGWISAAWGMVTGAADDEDVQAAAEEAAEETGEAAEAAGQAVEAGAEAAAEELKK